MEIYGIDLLGSLALNGNEGTVGQLVASAGPAAIPTYVSPASVVTAGVTVSASYVGTLLTITVNGQSATATVAGSAITVNDTNSIDLTLAGSALSAALIVDPVSTNLLSVSGTGAKALLTGANSLTGAGTVGSPAQLVGDVASPGNNKVYGTDGVGTRGWQTNVSRAFKQTFASATSFTVTHNLGNQYPILNVYRTDTTPPRQIVPLAVNATNANSLTITLSIARPIAITVVG